MRIEENLSHKKTPSWPSNECQPYVTIKTPKSSQTKGRIIPLTLAF